MHGKLSGVLKHIIGRGVGGGWEGSGVYGRGWMLREDGVAYYCVVIF